MAIARVNQSMAAQHWLRQAAEGGHLEAQLWLGELYYREAFGHSGAGSIRLEQHAMTQAMAWFHRAAEAGSSTAHAWIGHLLLWGIGQEADPVALAYSASGINLIN